ncbi:helix-turn-helix domain-containing protein [Brevundimonas sp.]|uniref:helix-turn-helix domain-containing protein n=1 Tax=Brevundimonas sp. TaxID=1871086 RepID=UPI003523B353
MTSSDSQLLNPEACRAARALLRWSMRDLAAAAGVSLETVLRIEQGAGPFKQGTLTKLCDAFAAEGVDVVVEPARSGATIDHRARGGAADG